MLRVTRWARVARDASSLVRGPQLLENASKFIVATPCAREDLLSGDFVFCSEFLTQAEADSLMPEIELRLRKFKYENEHMDRVIDGYREVIFTNPKQGGPFATVEAATLQVLRDAVGQNVKFLATHVLDLNAQGSIRAHVDGKHLSGEMIAGISLLSARVLRFRHTERTASVIDVLLPPRSLYIQRSIFRYNYTHEILPVGTLFNGAAVEPSGRRISLMFRDELVGNKVASGPRY